MDPKRSIAVLFAVFVAVDGAAAPEPTQTVYKCVQNGRVEYTATPCLGAKEVDVTPTKGAETYPGANL
ncbi:hypothetical protein [Pelomonas sp. KK5]|uniref:hypothetical protein n=1 Tax=Pelomonas sp. KK5 TaxID=1855730 RepID=UPI00117CEF1B|nr:hypothetical protein [Pelomonas sp. KK5]